MLSLFSGNSIFKILTVFAISLSSSDKVCKAEIFSRDSKEITLFSTLIPFIVIVVDGVSLPPFSDTVTEIVSLSGTFTPLYDTETLTVPAFEKSNINSKESFSSTYFTETSLVFVVLSE